MVTFIDESFQANKKITEKITEKSTEKILHLIEINNEITISEIAAQIHFSTSGVEKKLAMLQKKGILKRVGPDKGGSWKIIDNSKT